MPEDITIQPRDITHPTERTAIVEADIDKEIKPLITWMNQLWGVTTLFCCQGNNPSADGHTASKPYVLFLCSDSLSLIRICSVLPTGSSIEVEFYAPLGGLRYHLRFVDKKDLKRCVARLSRR